MVNRTFSAAHLPICATGLFTDLVTEIKENGPQYEHDCECCTFLGRHTHNEKPVDLYFCTSQSELIARESSDGPRYRSISREIYTSICHEPSVYREVYRRAYLLGLIVS